MILRIAHGIVARKREILAIALLLLVVGGFGLANASIEYDMLTYVPAELDSVKGFQILNDDFSLGNTAQVLLEGVSEVETARIVDKIDLIEGISDAAWLTDFEDIAVPTEFWDADMTSTYINEDSTFIAVNFEKGGNDPLTRSAFEDLKELLADETASITGTQQLELEDVVNADRTKFAAAALILVAVTLALTVPSAIIPLLLMATISLAVVYNLGMSYYLGQRMSYLTGVIVFALQFAVTMDYALFLYHRYEEERKRYDNDEAMTIALASTFKSVVAASLTTIAGFMALTAMRLEIGADLGLTLARGVAITVVAVLTVLPALMLYADPLVRRFAHKVHLPKFAPLGRFLAKHAGIVSLVTLLAFVPAVWGYSQLELNYNLDESLPEDLPSLAAADRIAEAFEQYQTAFVILEDTGRGRDLDHFTQDVLALEGVSGAFSYTELIDPLIPAEFIPESARDSFYKSGHTYMSVDIAYEMGDSRTEGVIEALRNLGDTYPGEAYVTGQGVLLQDMEDVSIDDVDRVNIISIIAIAIIVALAFRSLSVPLVLLAGIELAIFTNQAIAAAGGEDIIFIASLAIGAIQLGATVDYAIILTTRFEEELRRLGNRVDAMEAALGGAAPSILVSASTMFSATVGMVFLSSVATITDLTLLIARGAVVSFFVVVFLLPGLLVFAQPLFERTSIGWPRLARKKR